MLLPPGLREIYLLTFNGAMARAYEPGVYDGSMIVFRSPKIFKDPYLGWKADVSETINTYDVPGDYKVKKRNYG
ncbi:MAG: hypothetical protein M3Z92_12140 [Bacteroidota bacterium]|nr:hypothetical protein [Bacteroidota bacterium]